MNHAEYLTHDALSLADLVRRGAVTPTELLELTLARIEALNPALNAVVRVLEEDARSAAGRPPEDAPFPGVPFLAKDLLSNYAPHPTSGASRLTESLPVTHDSEVARRVKAAGLVLVGKTNLPEWGLVPFTENELFGTCCNPWDLGRTPGGSSGGSAAAVAAGIVPMAGGGDGGGSIRIPASCCGIFGLKPSRGRVPMGPDQGLIWRGAVVEHVLTRSVRDSAAMLDATHGPDPGAPVEAPPPARPYLEEVGADPGRLRIAFSAEPSLGSGVDPVCVAAVEDAAALLESMGHTVEEARPPVDRKAFSLAFLTMVAAELGADMDDFEVLAGRKPRRRELEPTTWALALLSQGISARRYASALRVLERATRAAGPFFEEYDLLLTPTLATPPAPHGTLGPSSTEERLLRLVGALGSGTLVRMAGLLDQAAEDVFDFMPWTPLSNISGQPAMSVPLFWSEDDLPIGVHLVGRYGREDLLFRVAGRLEEARPWFDRLPPLARSLA